ncbi:hypothetical protein CcaverHIS631_0506890 [Cutaneotrichosporon cavernicola]|nr:hypothetical protein CcaverHIS631_0506890 [Cutaneotrichosporon cavernicola]
METFKGETAHEIGVELDRTDLLDPSSVQAALVAVKTYALAKMRKSKSNAVGQPGGKLEVLERKYGNAGYHDIFYLARLELQFPPSNVPLPHPSPAVTRRLEAAGFPFWDNLLVLPPTRPASISSGSTVSAKTVNPPRARSNSSLTFAPAISARSAYKIPGALLAIAPQPRKTATVSTRSALKVPGALLNPPPPPDDMPFNSKKTGKAFGKAFGRSFTAMYATAGVVPVSVATPAHTRMQVHPTSVPKSDRDEQGDDARDRTEKDHQSTSDEPVRHIPTKSVRDSPAEVTRVPQYSSDQVPSERHLSSHLRPPLPQQDSRPESGLLPDNSSVVPGVGYRDEKHAIMTSSVLGPVDSDRNAGRWPDHTYANTKHSWGSQMHSLGEEDDNIRQLFNALPPDAQALAYARLAEQRERKQQAATNRNQVVMTEREAEACIEQELREKGRAREERKRLQQGHGKSGHVDKPDCDNWDAYDGAYLSSPAGRMVPPVPSRQQSADTAALQRQVSNTRRVPAGPRRRLSPQEEVEEQIAQLFEAQTLPPRPAHAPARHTSLRTRSSDSPSTISHFEGPPRTLSDPAAPRAFAPPRTRSDPPVPRTLVPPRPEHDPVHAWPSPRPRLTSSPSHSPELPHYNLDFAGPPSQMSTPRTRAAGGDAEVRAALAAKIKALQAALSTLDVEDDDDVSEIASAEHLPMSHRNDMYLFPSTPAQSPAISPKGTMRVPSPADSPTRPENPAEHTRPEKTAEPTPSHFGWMQGAPEWLQSRPGPIGDLSARAGTHSHSPRTSIHKLGVSQSQPQPRGGMPNPAPRPRPVGPHDILRLDDLLTPQPRANARPIGLRDQLTVEAEPISLPSSELGSNHIIDNYDHRGFRRTPPPEYTTIGPDLSVTGNR